MKLYIDGQIVGTTSSTGLPPLYATPIAGAIGARSRADIQFFNGKIDDVKIYNGALTSEEVTLLYNEEQGECSSPCTGMIYSLGSGNWSTPATWSCGRVPDLTDKVLIKAGHTVTITTNDGKVRKLLTNGQVSFANSTSKLTFSNGIRTYTYISQPGPLDGKDTDASSYTPNTNNGNNNFMDPWTWTQSGAPSTKRCFVGFDLSAIPTNAVVDSAYFSLYFSQTFLDTYPGFVNGHVGNNSLFIKRITSSWTELELTWNTQPSTTDTNQLLIPSYTNERQDYQRMNVKNLVTDMIANPSTSHGFMIRHQVEDPYKITVLTTSEDATPNSRPKLQVFYHLP
jgi:hypothetical protein